MSTPQTAEVTQSFIEYLLATDCNVGLEMAAKYVLEQATFGLSPTAIAEGLLRLRYTDGELRARKDGP